MSEEIKEILDRLDFKEWEVDLYKVPITWCELYDIRDYITNLQQKVEQLEKDKSYANWYAVKKEKEVEQLENIRKEAREFVKNNKDKTIAPYGDNEDTDYEVCLFEEDINDLLNILNKGSDKE